MKKISISVNTLNAMEKSGMLFSTAEDAQRKCDADNRFGTQFEVAAAYEMVNVCKKIEYKVFRGYFLRGIY